MGESSVDEALALSRAIEEAARTEKVYPSRRRLVTALRFAVSLIESYQLDIRESEQHVGIDLAAQGFCQGQVYANAHRLIRQQLEGEN